MLAEGLLQACVEFVAEAGSNWPGVSLRAGGPGERHEFGNYGDSASRAGNDQILIEGAFHRACIGNTEHRIGRLNVVSNAEAGFRLRGMADPSIKVPANSKIEGPIPFGDGVLDEEPNFFYVRVSMKMEELTGRVRQWICQIELRGYGASRVTNSGAGGYGGAGNRGDVPGIDDSEMVIFRQERVLHSGACLEIVNAFHVGNTRAHSGIQKRSVLSDRRALQIRTEVRKRVPTRIVVVVVAPYETSQGQY